MKKKPKAKKVAHVTRLHGKTLNDPYFWMRDSESKEVKDYLGEEEQYADSISRNFEETNDKLFLELKSRIKEEDVSVPEQDGPYEYYYRFEKGKQYPIYCRRAIENRVTSDLDKEEVILDINVLSRGHDFYDVGIVEPSPCHRYLAYSSDEKGAEEFTVYIKDLQSGKLIDQPIPKSFYSFEWTNDSKGFYYNILDEHQRPLSVYYHTLGTEKENDRLIYKENDPRFFVSITKSESRKYIFIVSDGNNMSEWHYTDADSESNQFELIEPRSSDHEYSLTHQGDFFFIRTNLDGAKDFKVSKTKVNTPNSDHWLDFVPHQTGTLIEGLTAFKNYLILSYRENGLQKQRVYPCSETNSQSSCDQSYEIQFEETPYTLEPVPGREFDSETFRIAFSSLKTPRTVYDVDLSKNKKTLRKKTEVPHFNSDNYVTRQIFALSHDQKRIPISIIYHKNTPIDGTAPLKLEAYGSYGISRDPEFRPNWFSLIDRGFVYAIAHVRGGMELGWNWYEEGKLLKKKNTFLDFIACTEHLISEGYTQKGNVVAQGGSAGGLLIGAVGNLRPDLYKCLIADVPFVDCLNTMLDDTLPLTTMEYNEWGNPNNKEFFDYIQSYSPYDNVQKQDYPHLLVLAGLHDPRVTYWEPLKWVAKLRELKTDDNLLILKMDTSAGHGGASGRFDFLKEVAFHTGFTLYIFEKPL